MATLTLFWRLLGTPGSPFFWWPLQIVDIILLNLNCATFISWICVIAHCHCNIFQPLEWQKRQWCDAQKQKMVYGYGYGSVWSPSLACSVQQSDSPLLKRKNLPHLLNDNCFFLAFLPFQSCAVVLLNVRCEVWLLCDDPTSRQDGTATATRTH